MPSELTRRNFARAALASAVGVSVVRDALASPPAVADKPADVRKKSDVDDARIDSAAGHLVEIIRERYPDPRLTGKVLAEIRRDVASGLSRGKTLRRFPLSNADEPGFVFAPYRSDAIR